MNMPKWLEKRIFNYIMKSLSYRVLIGDNRDGEPYYGAHSDEDELATSLLFGKVPAVHAGVKAISSAIAMVPIRVVGPNGRERPNHPMAKLIERPNDFDTTFDLMEQTAIFLELTGTMPWYLEGPGVAEGAPPETIVPLHPNRVTPIPSKKSKISGYKYGVEDRVMTMTKNEVVYFTAFDPSDPLGIRGLGSAEVASSSAIVDRLAATFNQRFFRRGAVLSGVIETDSEDIDPAVMEKYAQQFRDKHAGSDNAWDVRGLSHGLKWKPTQPTHTDMLFEKLRTMNREEMLMAEGVPPIMVTLMDGATYANAQQQEYAFMVATILPKIRKIQARMNRDIASRYSDNVKFLFDISEIRALQPDWQVIKETVVPLLERRTMTPNEARQFLSTGRMPKLEDAEHGDEFLTNFQIMPMDEMEPLDSPQAPDVGGDQNQDPDNDAPQDVEDQVQNLFGRMKLLASGLDTETRRKRSKREKEALTAALERVFFNITMSMMTEQRKAVLDYIEKNAATLTEVTSLKFPKKSPRYKATIDAASTELSTLLMELEEEYRAKYIGIYTEAVSRSGQQAASALPMGFTYSSGTLSALSYVETTVGATFKEIHDTTLALLRESIAEGIALGETAPGLATRVQSVMGQEANRSRAMTIARTEMNSAINFGQVDSWKQSGVVERKRWSIADGDARTSHLEADGQVVGINENFTVGGYPMAYPGDSSQGAGAEEIVNCRCDTEPVLAGEEASYEHAGVSKGNSTGRVRHAGTTQSGNGNGKQGVPALVAGRLQSLPEGRGRNGRS